MDTVLTVMPNLVTRKVATICTHSNEKGGVGKTTTEFNQAYRLAEQGYRVLVIDVDGQRNMSKLLLGSIKEVEWIENHGFTSPSLFEANLNPEKIVAYQSPIHPNLHIIPAHKARIANILSAGKEAVGFVANLKKYIVQLDYDFIFIDTPPSLGVTQVAAINAVDYIFIPVTVDDFSNEGLISLLKTINAVKKGMRSNVQVAGVYLNFFKEPTARKGENPYLDILRQIEKDYKDLLMPFYIKHSLWVGESRMAGKACWVSPPNGNAATVGRAFRNAIDALNAKIMK
ncbi:ParA family protein [Shewanella baltica]|uniref:ParA family protein n=1 Tax=Shewanella baltica TaxID=62322 RepID=UPI00217F1B18|nr:ParA family protein [Shewanella baltica]MCS6271874.1 ParA family protein [Shewanella baltica]